MLITKDPAILLAEDDENDVLLFRIALDGAHLTNPVYDVPDGRKAIEYLKGEGPFADRLRYPLPGVLLMDLKMPRMNGFELLKALQEEPDLKQMPVVVLSSSSQPSDIKRAWDLGADDYQVKPHSFEALTEKLQE